MAREGKKLELYEILAAKRAKGKMPPGFEGKPVKQANVLESEQETPESETVHSPGLIIDDAVRPELIQPETPPVYQTHSVRENQNQLYKRERDREREREREKEQRERERQPEPAPEPPRPRSPREVVFALDTAFIFFTVVLALIGSSYFLGYKRGQEERPDGLTGAAEIDLSNPDRVNLRLLSPAPRSTMRPPETDFTLVLRTEPASDDLPERLELELAEAVARGRQQAGTDIQGFIFRTGGNDPRYVLSVGLGRTATDAELNRLLEIYYKMEGVTLSREPRPYIGSRIAPVRELGVPVY